jgi:hypothetical protein
MNRRRQTADILPTFADIWSGRCLKVPKVIKARKPAKRSKAWLKKHGFTDATWRLFERDQTRRK